jgi:hypothetical protein
MAMTDLDILFCKYAQFEENVNAAMTGMCAGFCRVCARVCCREEFCRETIESPFLSLLHHKFSPPAAYSSENGWLTPAGCALSIGRAPVCYHFLCRDIRASQPTQTDGYVLEVLGALINHVGKYALGRRHVVEIMNVDDLHRVKRLRFEKRLSQAQAAFNVIMAYHNHALLDDESIVKLSRIQSKTSIHGPNF